MAASASLIFGEDEFMVSSRARQLVEELVPEAERALGLETVDGRVETVDEAVQALRQSLEAVQTMGFFGGGKLVWLKDAVFLGGRAAQSPAVKELLDALLDIVKKGLPEGQKLLITTPKVNKASRLYKSFKAAGETLEFAVSAKSWEAESAAAEHVRQLLPEFGLQMDPGMQEAFLAKVGVDTRAIVNELEKLTLYKAGDPQRPVTAADIACIVCQTKGSDAWDLQDAFGDRDTVKSVKTLRRLLFQKESPIRLISSLVGRTNELLIFREALDRGWLRASGGGRFMKLTWESRPEVEALCGALERDPRKTNPYRAGRLVAQAKQFSLRELRLSRHVFMQTHEKLVSTSLPADTVLELALLRVLPVATTPRPRGE